MIGVTDFLDCGDVLLVWHLITAALFSSVLNERTGQNVIDIWQVRAYDDR